MKWLVCRKDAIRPDGHMRTSEYFPKIVEANSPSEAIENCFPGELRMNQPREWIVLPMTEAYIVRAQPVRPLYELDVKRYLEWGVR